MTTQTVEERFRFFSDREHRYELRTINAGCFPVNPTHPRLLENVDSFPVQSDGTYGDRDWLISAFPFQKNRTWIHYIPTRSVWKGGVPGFDTIPIYAKPRESGDAFWSNQGRCGRFRTRLLDDIRHFHDEAVPHALKLKDTAEHYTRMPIYGNQIKWKSLEGVGTFSQMIFNLVDIQRRVAELYGWICLQEKLQPNVRSILPTPALSAKPSTIDFFNGVIVHWPDRVDGFVRMAMLHGVALWWCDYIPSDSQSNRAPWVGLPSRGLEESSLLRGSGYTPVGKDDLTYTITIPVDPTHNSKSWVDTLVASARPSISSTSTPRTRSPTQISHTSSRHQNSFSSSSVSASTSKPSTTTTKPTTTTTTPRTRIFYTIEEKEMRERSTAKRLEHERNGTAYPRNAKARKRANNPTQRERAAKRAKLAEEAAAAAAAAGLPPKP